MAEPSIAVVADKKAPRTQINAVLFSGGSGTHSIAQALLRHPQIRLRILINAYDDGHSTGRLRRFIPSMLGPSDVRKNINRLMPVTERCHKALKVLSDYRLAVGIARADALALITAFASGDRAALPPPLATHFGKLTLEQAEAFRSLLETFLTYFQDQEREGKSFDFTDCALGNLLFAGCYLQQQQDFNRAIDAFCVFYDVPPGTLLNVTRGENLFLVAQKADGSMLLGEADIVAAQSSAKITDLYLVDEQIYLTEIEPLIEAGTEPPTGWAPLIHSGARTPLLNPAAAAAITEADVIVYGPGTQHSSLFPSYMTKELGEAIAGNPAAEKIFIGNIIRDLDIQEDDVNDLADKFMDAMTRKSQAPLAWRDCVTQFFVQDTEDSAQDRAKYIPFDPKKFKYPLETIRLRDWESVEGRHSGGLVLDELQQIVQSRIDVELQRIQHMISIVVPVLNEASTLLQVLKSLLLLDFQPLGLTKEIIVVDGGSTDESKTIARSVQTVRAFDTVPGAGRGAALRLGIEMARGSIIAFFPSDQEYKTEDLYALTVTLAQSNYRVVFGTRATKVRDLSEQLKTIYADNRGLYLTSKYGGMLLSILTLLLYNRYISDVLTSVKIFDALLLRGLHLERSGRDLDAEICAKLGLFHEYVLELPVDYHPRTHLQGKKITILDGLHMIAALIRYRFGGLTKEASREFQTGLPSKSGDGGARGPAGLRD
jgi:2-phospho-L-lactate transferase/gluconeogenesis factor (CofD/UPF0052 family)/glycosyltransferase involved in cell wall biosynthesis